MAGKDLKLKYQGQYKRGSNLGNKTRNSKLSKQRRQTKLRKDSFTER